MDRGYIKLWRKSLDSGLIQNHNAWILWTYCLLKSNHKKDFKKVVGFQEILLQPGQFIFGRKRAAEETGLSEQQIRTCLSFLKKCKNLTIKSTNKFSIISIINWGCYQHTENKNNQQSNQQVTSSQPASNHKQEQKNRRTEEEQIDEPKKPGSSSAICPQIKIRKLYNSILPELPEVKSTNRTVEAMVRKRWREDNKRQSLGWWHNYFTGIRDMDFLMGKVNGKHFNATFEWLVRPTNMSKVLNGNYKNKENTPWVNF